MIAQVARSVSISRRRLLAGSLCAAAVLPTHGAGQAQARVHAREAIARVDCKAGFSPPLTLGMARIILRPNAATWAGTPGGARLLVVESGVLGVTTINPAHERLTAATFAEPGPVPEDVDEILIPAGVAVTFNSQNIATVRNAGERAVVALDVAIYTEEPRTLPRAFTTEDGVSFQLLASASASSVPPGSLTVTLERLFLGVRGAAPDDLSSGLMLAYVETGALRLNSAHGEVSSARAAASAPYSVSGSLQPLSPGRDREVTAGGVIFLSLGGQAGMVNTTERPVELLTVAVREAA